MPEKKDGAADGAMALEGGFEAREAIGDFPLAESDLARDFGVTREAMRELRRVHLVPGDFALTRRGACLTEDAAERLRRALGLPGAVQPHEEEPEKKEAGGQAVQPWSQRPVVVLFVKRLPANARIVIATEDKELAGAELRVRVGSNRNFIKRMEMKAKLEHGTLYSLVGRLPRQKGRY